MKSAPDPRSIRRRFSFLGLAAGSILAASLACAAETLPLLPPAFKGKIGAGNADSTPDWPQPVRPPAGVPNIVVVLLDDAGFAATSTFGGVARTPQLDRLARQGVVYNRFHTVGICSPTRAALLTGRNHHQVGFGTVAEGATGYPSYNGVWNPATVCVAEVLRQHGYSTAAFGKWHNTPTWEISPAGPFDRWPTHLGFDYFYGFQGGAASQYEPRLYRNTLAVEPPKTPAQGYHLTTDLVDDAIHWLNDLEAVAPAKPYFLYFATGAVHSPHHVPQPWIDKYRGQFDQGWDRLRAEAFQRQKQLGVIPATAELTPRPAAIPGWDSLAPDQRRVLAREMEVFAGFMEHTDFEVGRLLERVQRGPGGDNTLIFYVVGDNGGSAEGGLYGTDASRAAVYGNQTQQTITSLERLGELGGPQHDNNYAIGWAWATSAPFQWLKQIASHFGGVRNPLVVSWPKGIKSTGLRTQFHHVNDIAPTIYEITGIPLPVAVNGIEQLPLEGKSLAYSFDNPGAPGRVHRQYFEQRGNRAIYDDGWVAAAYHQLPWQPEKTPPSVGDDRWELYHIDDDFSEAHNVAARYPDKLKELIALFYREAERNRVYPLFPAGSVGFDSPLAPAAGRTTFTYFSGTSRLPPSVLPGFSGRSHRLTMEVDIPAVRAEGVIVAQGGRHGGFVLYLRNGRLVYENNLFARAHEQIVSRQPLPSGRHTIVFEFVSETGKPLSGGTGRILLDGAPIGEGKLSRFGTALGSGYETLDVGADLGGPVSSEYSAPFRFTGVVEKVTLELQ